jgi:cobalt transporter subunit CbtB
MNVAATTTVTTRTTGLTATVFAMILGVALVTIAGHVQASGLHAAAHDVRHATGFPCH